ncbi:MAG: chemotaxis protein, partial [Verrucomicrobiales bacterium]|nr:chemotaxis protein [Verrucomicrobiales bacterium]
MFARLSLSWKLNLGFFTVVLIAAALGAFAYFRLTQIKESSDAITMDNMPGIILVDKAKGLIDREMELAARHMLCTEKPEMERVEKEMAENRTETAKTLEQYQATIFEARDRELFNAIAPLGQAFQAVVENQLLPLSRLNKEKEAKAVLDGPFNDAYDKYVGAVGDLVEFNKTEGTKSAQDLKGDVSSAKLGIIIGLILSVACGALIGIFLSRSISNALNKVIASLTEGSEQVSSASGQVSQSSQQMAEGASEQAS